MLLFYVGFVLDTVKMQKTLRRRILRLALVYLENYSYKNFFDFFPILISISVHVAIKVLTADNVQLHVRMELEHERRVRTQLALDEAERNFCSARRDAENR